MASPTALFSSKRIRVSKLFTKVFIAVVVLTMSAALGVYTWFRSASSAALPQLDGHISVVELAAPVSVIRDAQGVPHIAASSVRDLVFAQGYVTAQDRLWQMDIQRRYAAGELSEVLGSGTVPTDVEQRTLGLRQVATRAAAELSESDRALFQAYANGVNAYIQQHRDSLPLEFRVLRYAPRAWAIEDSFLTGVMMAELLNHGQYLVDLQREKMLAALGPELYGDLYVNTSFRDHPPGASASPIRGDDSKGNEREEGSARKRGPGSIAGINSGQDGFDTAAFLAAVNPPSERDADFIPGSNNWVVSGAHTASGKPLLSNDMHLPHQLPNIWYESHLTAGDFDVAGVTLPGLPFVIVGHNRRIAWGFTNINPDVQDVYIENFNAAGEYRTPAGWTKPELRTETIKVKRGRDVSLNVVTTRHGPIVSGLVKNESRRLALKWSLLQPGGMSFPFYDVNRAQNWEQFRQAFSNFGGPGQNAVYADVDGHIGYQATGRVPIRSTGDGSLPVTGTDDAHEWTGYIDWEKMPRVFDPLDGIIATANGRITPEGYPYPVSTEWAGPYRTERIYRLLRSKQKLTPQDMLSIQTDVYSVLDKFLAERFAYAIDHQRDASARTKQAADILRSWSGTMSIDSAAPTIVTRGRKELLRIMLEPKLGKAVDDYRWWMSGVFLENAVLGESASWLPKQYSSYEALLAAAMDAALKDAPRDLNAWTWGKSSTISVKHFVFGGIPILARISGTDVLPQSGNGDTVKQVGKTFGPSERMTVDFANLDSSTLNIVNGQSGNLGSPHYNDQWQAWYSGTTFALPFSKEAVERAGTHRLQLVPEGS